MLLPLGDDNSGRTITPYVTYTLMALNIAVFLLLQLPSPNDVFTYGYAVIPAELTRGVDLTQPIPVGGGLLPQAPGPQPIYLTILSAMFMHGGWAHLGGNMLYLWIFGDNVEDALGHFKFLCFYLLCGVLATAAHIVSEPGSIIPSLGASGAIAGVLGGYLLLYPTRQVRVLIGFFLVSLPAFIVLGGWILMQVFSSVGSIARTEETGAGGVAYWAHVGGAVAGFILVSLFKNPTVTARAQERMGYPTGQDYRNLPPRVDRF